MAGHIDVGNAGIYGSAVGGLATGTAAAGWIDVVNGNALLIGLILTVVSLLVGVAFKVIAVRQTDRHHREEMAAQKEHNAKLAEALLDELRKPRP